MKLTYYQGDIPNFGDDLNRYMWSDVIDENLFDDNENELFLGIGSIIGDNYPKNAKKIVVGSGYAAYRSLPNVHDNTWKFCFVRGRRTAKKLDISEKYAITDAAILAQYMEIPDIKYCDKVGFMPHFLSVERANWKKLCKQANVEFIDPTNPDVRAVLAKIRSLKLLITEAMHGAILADTLRTPWVPMLPLHSIHREKWYDWAESMSVNFTWLDYPPTNIKEYYAKKFNKLGTGKASQMVGSLFSFTDSWFEYQAIKNLNNAVFLEGFMSDDKIFSSKSEQVLDTLSKLKGVNIKI